MPKITLTLPDSDTPVNRFLITIPRQLVKAVEEVAVEESGSSADTEISDLQMAQAHVKDLIRGYLADMVVENTVDFDDTEEVGSAIRVDRLPDLPSANVGAVEAAGEEDDDE
jgi:hypothetical protein